MSSSRGGIDLSVGSVLGLSAIVLGVAWQNLGLPLPVAMAVAILVGALCGAINGLIIVKTRMPPLIATLGTLALFRGFAEGISQARSVRGYPDWFYVLGQGDVLGVPTQLWIFGFLAVVAAIILGALSFGRVTYAIGANETAARFSGMAVDRAKLLIYAASGALSGTAAVIFVSRVSTTRSDMGTGIEMDVISAVVLGGTSIFGGRGTIHRHSARHPFDPGAEKRTDARRDQRGWHDHRDRFDPDPDHSHQQSSQPDAWAEKSHAAVIDASGRRWCWRRCGKTQRRRNT